MRLATLLAPLALVLGFAASAQTPPPEVADSEAPMVAEAAPEVMVLDAAETSLDDHLWVSRVLVVFAQTERDPRFQEQIAALQADPEAILSRDLVVIVDADPAARSSVRGQLRPRGFMLAIIEKDGQVMTRKPSPRTTREIAAIVDRFPMRRQEMLERRPAGR